MRPTHRPLHFAGALILLLAFDGGAAGLPAGFGAKDLRALKENNFALPDGVDPQPLALAVADYLGDPDPVLRDELAFGALQHWMRTKALPPAAVRELSTRLSGELRDARADNAGFRKPFAALTLAEVARYDRLEATLDPVERAALVNTAVRYLTGITDYRGFDERAGYRHGVAHAADLLLQLSLNPALEKPQLDAMKTAIAAKLTDTGGHAYVYGEPGRLTAPVFYIAKRQLHSAAEWTQWLGALASPKPEESWAKALGTQRGWARKHNVEAFLLNLYASVRETENQDVRAALLPGVTAAVKALP